MKKLAVSKAIATRVRKALKEMVGSERGGLFPLHLDIVRDVSGLEFNEGDEDTYSALLESICGATDDSQPVEQYDGTLGVTAAFVAAHQSPVGQLQWNNNLAAVYTNPGNVSGVRWCTGTLISNDLFISAGHCFDQTGGGWIRPVDNTTGVTISPRRDRRQHARQLQLPGRSGRRTASRAVVSDHQPGRVPARRPRLLDRPAWR